MNISGISSERSPSPCRGVPLGDRLAPALPLQAAPALPVQASDGDITRLVSERRAAVKPGGSGAPDAPVRRVSHLAFGSAAPPPAGHLRCDLVLPLIRAHLSRLGCQEPAGRLSGGRCTAAIGDDRPAVSAPGSVRRVPSAGLRTRPLAALSGSAVLAMSALSGHHGRPTDSSRAARETSISDISPPAGRLPFLSLGSVVIGSR